MKQSSLFEIDQTQCSLNLLPVDGSAQYYPGLIGIEESAGFIDQLQKSLHWEADQLMMFGRLVTTRQK